MSREDLFPHCGIHPDDVIGLEDRYGRVGTTAR